MMADSDCGDLEVWDREAPAREPPQASDFTGL